MTATILPPAKTQFFDASGNPLAGGFVYHYIPLTTTAKTTWQDANAATANSQPIQLDGSGEALIWGVGEYRQVVYDSLLNLIWDQVTLSPGATGSGAFFGTSTTSLLIGLGAKTFTTQTALQFTEGQYLIASSDANAGNFMVGTVTSYATGSGALVMNILTIGGSGTHADWNISITGIPGVVSAVSITTANGFSGSSSGGATPALTIVAGAIVPTSVNGLTFATQAIGYTIAGGTSPITLKVNGTTGTNTANIVYSDSASFTGDNSVSAGVVTDTGSTVYANTAAYTAGPYTISGTVSANNIVGFSAIMPTVSGSASVTTIRGMDISSPTITDSSSVISSIGFSIASAVLNSPSATLFNSVGCEIELISISNAATLINSYGMLCTMPVVDGAGTNISNAYGYRISGATLTNSGSIGNCYGVYIGNMGDASISASYGIFIEAQTSSSGNTYAILYDTLFSVDYLGAIIGAGLTSSDNLTMSVAAKGLTLKQGSNGRVGTVTLAGTAPVTVSNTSVAITDFIGFSLNTATGTVGAHPIIKTITAATGFTVAGSVGDVSTYNYAITKNA